MNKNTIPQNFTLSLALVDFIPVIFFFLTCSILGFYLNSFLFIIGAIICFISGLLKVIWKIIVVKKKKNIWPLFLQMRIAMPIGFLIIIISFILNCINQKMNIIFNKILTPFPLTFLIIGLIGMILMSIFAFKLDSSKLKANWIEQICNSISQCAFFIAILIMILN